MNVKILSLVLLLLLSFNTWVDRLSVEGIDFYHYWGVAKAQQVSPSPLQNPYISAEAYGEALNQYADASDEYLLKAANASRRQLDLTGTPLLYTVFSLLPERYNLAITVFRLVQLILFILAIVVIGLLRDHRQRWGILSLVLSATFFPFLIDVTVGNLNTVQLFLLATSVLLLEKIHPRTSNERLVGGLIVTGCLIFIILLKPNLLIPSLLLGAVFLAKYGLPRITILIPFGVVFTTILVFLTNVCLGSSRVWLDWYHLVSASQGRLAYPIEASNYSTALLISQLYDIELYAAVQVITLFLLVSFASVVTIAALKRGLPLVRGSGEVMLNILNDAGLGVSIAVTATIAISPLVWVHYYTLLLLPALWLIDSHRPSSLGNWLSLLAVLCSGGLVAKLFSISLATAPELHAASFMLGWVWSWTGLLVTIVHQPLTSGDPLGTK